MDEQFAAQAEHCTWTYDEHFDVWEADCGAAWTLTDGGPEWNEYNFCPSCGRRVAEAEPA